MRGDIWVPVGSSDNKDWVQIGECGYHNAGKSHVKAFGYPSWGDSKPNGNSADSQQYMVWIPNPKPERFEISKVERDQIRSIIRKTDQGLSIDISESNSIGNIKGISL